jgi:hypothetical protein
MMLIRSQTFALAVLLLSATGAAAQLPPPVVGPPAPNLNPSSSFVVPQQSEVPVSPASPGSVFSTGANLAGTNEVVNPAHSVFHSHHRRHHHYAE